MMADHAEALKRGDIDYDEALERFGGNAALFERLAAKFLDDGRFAALEQAFGAGDWDAALHEAHTLKGVAGNLSFGALYATAGAVDEALRDGDVDAAAAHMADVRAAHAAVVDALRAAGA